MMKHRRIKKTCKLFVIFLVMGVLYAMIEITFRGWTTFSMFVLGGVCGVIIGLLNEVCPDDLGIVWQCLIGGAIVTIAELIAGLILNVWLGLGVWDYSNLPLNFMGQICLPFSLAWCGLSLVAIVLDDYLRYWWFGEEKPSYTLF